MGGLPAGLLFLSVLPDRLPRVARPEACDLLAQPAGSQREPSGVLALSPWAGVGGGARHGADGLGVPVGRRGGVAARQLAHYFLEGEPRALGVVPVGPLGFGRQPGSCRGLDCHPGHDRGRSVETATRPEALTYSPQEAAIHSTGPAVSSTAGLASTVSGSPAAMTSPVVFGFFPSWRSPLQE